MSENSLQSAHQDTLSQLADKLVNESIKLRALVKTEEDLRVGFEKLLEPIRTILNISSTPAYEKSVFSGRADAVHGQVIIEYELPGSFSSKKNIEHTTEQLINYLRDEAKESKLTRLVGVGFDGEQIFFIQYQGENDKEIDSTKFLVRGPYNFDAESARTFLIHLRALSRLALTAENLAQRFGPQSELAPKMIGALASAIKYWGDQTRIRIYFQEWKRLFGIIYGEQFNGGIKEKEAETLSRLYKVAKETDFQELLFSVHTYFAFLMKLIAAELLTLRETSFGASLASRLVHISESELLHQLTEIESGGIYARKGITNFLEGDFFRWYLEAFDSPELKEAVREIARALSEFEPATSALDPISTRDLLKKLYQYLVPQEVRHRLGEYYTPDWLAELLLEEVSYNGNISKRFLDPACGSGTFLVLAIQRARAYGQKEKLPPYEVAKRILENIWGFDLNPLAVIAARTNYLFALGDLASTLPRVEIPIYLTDSVLTPTRTSGNLFGEYLEISTSVGTFQVPAEWVRDRGFLLARAVPVIEEMAKHQYSVDEAVARFRKEGLAWKTNEQIVRDFYSQILELEKEKKNGIWARFLKNAFAPVVAGKFDFVLGNPPWIRWEYLSKEYKEATKNLWDNYGLSIIKESKDTLSKGKRDFSMLFVYASADYYLNNKGKLGFLITQEVFKSKGAGEGFRRFQSGENGIYLKVLKAHDLASIQPFEGATNKTAAIIIRKGEKTEYPVPYFIWTKKKGIGKIPTDKPLQEVLPVLDRKKMMAKPISSIVSPWQSFTKEYEETLSKISGKNCYKAKIGARTEPYGIFWLDIISVLHNKNLLVKNITEGRRKKQVQNVEVKIENKFIYPGLRGADITRWGITSNIFVLVLHDPDDPSQPFPEDLLKIHYPLTYSYLIKFKKELLEREAYKKFHSEYARAFYAQFNISKDTFAIYKIVWKRMSNDIFATVVSEIKTPYGFKKAIPLDTTSLFSTNTEAEAHYLCAIINSKPIRDFIKSFSSAGRGFGTPSVMEHIRIPRFATENPLHQQLADISRKCHQLKLEGKESEIQKLEKEDDELVKRLFGIK